MTATDGDKDRPQNIVYFLTGQGIDPDNPANSKFDINRTTGEIFVLKVSDSLTIYLPLLASFLSFILWSEIYLEIIVAMMRMSQHQPSNLWTSDFLRNLMMKLVIEES